jgi:hypothetical protein
MFSAVTAAGIRWLVPALEIPLRAEKLAGGGRGHSPRRAHRRIAQVARAA